MKILVLSDSHRYLDHMQTAIEQENPTHVIHLGDHVRDAEELSRRFPMLPVLKLRGNCDFDYDCREQALVEYDGVRILAVHGHRYGVKSGLLRYELAARESQADVALFGHTHLAYCQQYEGLWLLNPGSCGYCARPSYGIITIKNGSADCRVETFD